MSSQHSAKMILNVMFLLSMVMASTLISFVEARQLNEKPKVGEENGNTGKMEEQSGTKAKENKLGDQKTFFGNVPPLPTLPFAPPLPTIPFLPPVPGLPENVPPSPTLPFVPPLPTIPFLPPVPGLPENVPPLPFVPPLPTIPFLPPVPGLPQLPFPIPQIPGIPPCPLTLPFLTPPPKK